MNSFLFLKKIALPASLTWLLLLVGCAGLPERTTVADPVFSFHLTEGSFVHKKEFPTFNVNLEYVYADVVGAKKSSIVILKEGTNFVAFPKAASGIRLTKFYGRIGTETNTRLYLFTCDLGVDLDVPEVGTIVIFPFELSYKETNEGNRYRMSGQSDRTSDSAVDRQLKLWRGLLKDGSWNQIVVSGR